jgi:hypothetical protein
LLFLRLGDDCVTGCGCVHDVYPMDS